MIDTQDTALNRFLNWWITFYSRLDGDSPVLDIDTLDNPGWIIQGLDPFLFTKETKKKGISLERSKNNWLSANFSCDYVCCAGGPVNLHDVFELFQSLAAYQEHRINKKRKIKSKNKNDIIEKIIKWYLSLCDGDWEHEGGVHIQGLANGCWVLTSDTGTFDHKGRKNVARQALAASRFSQSWIAVSNFKIECQVAPLELDVLLETFLNYVNGEAI